MESIESNSKDQRRKFFSLALMVGVMAFASIPLWLGAATASTPPESAEDRIELENCSQLGDWQACNEDGVVSLALDNQVLAVLDDSVLIHIDERAASVARAGGGELYRLDWNDDSLHGFALEVDRNDKAIFIELW